MIKVFLEDVHPESAWYADRHDDIGRELKIYEISSREDGFVVMSFLFVDRHYFEEYDRKGLYHYMNGAKLRYEKIEPKWRM